MAYRKEFELKETIDHLEYLRKKASNQRIKTRLLFLILKDDPRFVTRADLGNYLGVSLWTMSRWRNTYISEGIEHYISSSQGGKRREVISVDIHKGLSDKLHDSKAPLLGYNHAVEWVKEQYGITLKYNTLRTYMKRHFGTKLKTPRKSHYKKDQQAIEVFKKPSN